MSSVAPFAPAAADRYATLSALETVLQFTGGLVADALRELDEEVAGDLDDRIHSAFPELDPLLTELAPRDEDLESPEYLAVNQRELLETAKLLLVLAANSDELIQEAHRFIGLAQSRVVEDEHDA